MILQLVAAVGMQPVPMAALMRIKIYKESTGIVSTASQPEYRRGGRLQSPNVVITRVCIHNLGMSPKFQVIEDSSPLLPSSTIQPPKRVVEIIYSA
jgi:hypothetical protein